MAGPGEHLGPWEALLGGVESGFCRVGAGSSHLAH